VPDVLVVTDSERVFDRISAALEEPEVRLRWARSGAAVVASLQESPADLVVSDLQVGTMGGYAIAMDLALEAGAGRLPRLPVLLLLDRRADVFLARRTGVYGWVLKPLDPLRLRAATRALLSGQPYHDPGWQPGSEDVQAA
jgi:DNA-binding response OmpR family regulator